MVGTDVESQQLLRCENQDRGLGTGRREREIEERDERKHLKCLEELVISKELIKMT